MNKFFIAAALVATSFSALADGAEYEYPRTITASVSRAEVRAELARAAANGELVAGEQSYVTPATGRSLSRGEVQVRHWIARCATTNLPGASLRSCRSPRLPR